MFKSLKTTIEKWCVFGLTDDWVRLEQIECNRCVHLKILQRQMRVKSRSKHMQTYFGLVWWKMFKSLKTTIEKWCVFGMTDDWVQLEQIECNRCVNLKILQRQMRVKSRSKHMQTYFGLVWWKMFKSLKTTIEKWCVFGLTDDWMQLEQIECNRCVHLKILQRQMRVKSRSKHMQTYFGLVWWKMFKSLKTTIEKWCVFGLTDDWMQLEQIECNRCVHLKILQRQMRVKSRSKHMQTYFGLVWWKMFKSLKTTIEKWCVFGLTDDWVQLEQIECNRCVHLKILQRQMRVKSRSKHMQTYFGLVWWKMFKSLKTTIEKWCVFGLTDDWVQLEQIECNRCVHLKILQHQMRVKSRSKHMQTYFGLVWWKMFKSLKTTIEKWCVFGLTDDWVKLEQIECNRCVHLKILQRQMRVKSRSKHMQTYFGLVWWKMFKSLKTTIEKWCVFGLTDDWMQLEQIECNRCVHLKILQRQMRVKSRSKHMQTYFGLVWWKMFKSLKTTIEKWCVFGLTDDWMQLEQIECNRCVHLKILQRQMRVKSRSKHMQTYFGLVWWKMFKSLKTTIEKWCVFGLTDDWVQLESTRTNWVQPLRSSQNSAASDACQIPI